MYHGFIQLDDKGKLKIEPKIIAAIKALEDTGNQLMAGMLRKQMESHPQKDHSFHYLPYQTDSSFEQIFLKEVLTFPKIDSRKLEVYYNGDQAMTEFKIKCYKRNAGKWIYVGIYTPDFFVIQRKNGKINKVVIVETKGEIYANDPRFMDKRRFMETEFAKQNNQAFGYERFDYLYLEDTMTQAERILAVHKKTIDFFEEEVENDN